MAWFSLNATSGAATYGGRQSNANIAGATSAAVSPDGEHVYVTSPGADAVACFAGD